MKKQEVQISVSQMKCLVKRLETAVLGFDIPDGQRARMELTLRELQIELAILERKAYTENLLDAGSFTDEELNKAFLNGALVFANELGEVKGYRLFEATYVPNGQPNRVENWEVRQFLAKNKTEAVKIAREFGARIIGKKMVYVYLANRGL